MGSLIGAASCQAGDKIDSRPPALLFARSSAPPAALPRSSFMDRRFVHHLASPLAPAAAMARLRSGASGASRRLATLGGLSICQFSPKGAWYAR
jgi:hypothetical protein